MKRLILLFAMLLCLSFTVDNITQVSFYGKKFHGKTTASGEKFNMYANTAAHKTLPFGTKVEVTNLNNDKSVIVKINDRGPYIKGRKFDLSRGAFEQIAKVERGVIRIQYKIIK